MTDELMKANERARQQLEARAANTASGAGIAAAPLVLPGVDLRIGDRVFDNTSGLEGEVVAGARPSGGGDAAIYVRFATGYTMPRHRDELTLRPRLPKAKP